MSNLSGSNLEGDEDADATILALQDRVATLEQRNRVQLQQINAQGAELVRYRALVQALGGNQI